ncbi:MAG: GTPase Era [Clostridia bacterium]|nr:GTPase Era [Clostridia bacterium]
MTEKNYRSGFATIVGRPNVGKSTLLNTLVGEKVAITSNRPQTTRSRVMGVMSGDNCQIVFVDTPGIHRPRTKLGEFMVQSIEEAMEGIDALLVLADVTAIGPHDRSIIEEMSHKKVFKVLVLNKTDLVEPKNLLGIIDSFKDAAYDAILPVSARTGDGVEELKKELIAHLPLGPKYFPDDMLTDQPERDICAELIREKALRNLRDEVPHGIGVEMMAMKKLNDHFTEIDATIYCERDSHKGIIIGKKGAMLQKIGAEARADIEALLDTHVNLQLWVKVRPGWMDSAEDLKTLGYVKDR